MKCIICRRACARTMEFIILSMRKTENMVYSFDNKDDINKIKIHDCAFYGFEYKQKKSEVEIYCKNEMTKEEIEQIVNNYKKINNKGVAIVNFSLLMSITIKIVIFEILLQIGYLIR